MRNLTNTQATDLTGLHVQLVNPATGEQHKSYPADQLGSKLWDNATGTLTNVDQAQPLQALVEDTSTGSVAGLQLTTDQGGVATLYGSDKVVLQTGGELEMVGLPEDVDSSGTKVLVYNPGDYKVEYRDFPAGGATVVVTMNPPSADGDVEGAIWLVTDDGTPSGTVLEQYIWDVESATWVEMNRNAKSMLKFGTASPTSQGDWDGEEFFVTSDGTSTGEVLEQWVWDSQSSTWVQRPAGATVLNTTSTTAPDLLDPTKNTALANQMVTVGDEVYFVDANGKAVLVNSAPADTPDIPAAIAIGTQAQLNALAGKALDGKYIVTDGANKGDILQWTDSDGDGVGNTWVVYLTPPALANNAEWTVLTNATGEPAGQYTYATATDTWTKTSDVEAVIPPIDDPVAIAGLRFPTRHLAPYCSGSAIFIMGDSVAGYGWSSSGATVDGDNGGYGLASVGVRSGEVRKVGYTLYQADTPYTQIIDYRPYMVDVQQNAAGAVALDYLGNVFYKGTAGFMGAMTGTDSGASSVVTGGYVPDKFIAGLTSKVYKFWLAHNSNSLIVAAGDGSLYIKSNNGTTGVYGDGTVVANDLWHKVNVPALSWKKLYITPNADRAFALSNSGRLFFWGNNTTNAANAGGTGVFSTPVELLAGVGVKDFAADGSSTMVITSTGERRAIGTNTNGKFGNGNTTALTAWTVLPSNGFTYERVFEDVEQSNHYSYITTDGKAVLTGRQNLQRGIAGKTVADDVLTPTLIGGTSAFQGTVIDIRCYTNATLIHTNQGTVWTCVNSTGAGRNEHGWGINTVAGTNIGLNVFKKVPVPAPVASIQSCSDNTANYSPQFAMLTTEGDIYQITGASGAYDGGNSRFAPVQVGVTRFRQITPKKLLAEDLLSKVGTISAATPLTITSILDGGSNQTVTATFNATGTAGTVNLTGSTVTAPDVTFLSWLTNSVIMPSTNANLTVQFTVNAADIAALVTPNSQSQSWTLNLIVNGA